MNKVFKVIWNRAQGRFDVTSELSMSGKKTKSELNQCDVSSGLTPSSFKLSSLTLTLMMALFGNNAYATEALVESNSNKLSSTKSVLLSSANACDNDTLTCNLTSPWDYTTANAWGDAVVIGDGHRYVVNGPDSIVVTSSGTTQLFISDAIDKGYVTSATVNGATIDPTTFDARSLILLDFGAKNNTFTITDGTGVTTTVTTFTPDALQALTRDTQLLATVIDKDRPSSLFYQAGMLKVTNGIAEFNLKAPTIQNVYTKDTQLAYADGSGADKAEIIWTSTNNIKQASGVTGGSVPLTASFSRFKQVTAYDGSLHDITNIEELKSYNQWLIDSIKTNKLQAKLYDAELQKAYSQNSVTYIVDTSGGSSDPTLNAPIGSFAALYGTGSNATVTLRGELSGSPLNNTTGKNALILLENGALGSVDAGAKLIHRGGYGYSVSVQSGSTFVNNGLIDNAGTSVTYQAYVTGNGSHLINNGIFNLSPAGVYSSNYGMGVTLKEGHLTNNTGGIMNFSNGSYDNPGRVIGIDATGTGIGGYAVNNGIMTLGMMPVGNDLSNVTQVNTTAESRILNIGSLKTAGESQNNGTMVLGEKTEGTYAVYINQANDAGVNKKVFVNTITGIIDILGSKSETSAANFGIFATNSAKKIENAGTINVKGTNNIGIKVQGASQVVSFGTINVAGKKTINKLNNFGVWVEGNNSLAEVSGLINLTGDNTIGIHARDKGNINLTGNGKVTFAYGENQLGYYIYGANSKINNTSSGSQDVTTKNSTLMRLDGGASFTGSSASTSSMSASGENAKVIVATGLGTSVNSGGMSVNVSGKNAVGLQIEGGATGTIANTASINLSGQGSIAAIADGQGHDLAGNIRVTSDADKATTRLNAGASLNSLLDGVVGYIAKNLATLNNTGDITFIGKNTVGIQVEEGATGINSGNITLGDNGIGLVAKAENLNTRLTSTGNLILNGEGAIGISATGVKVVVDMKSDGISTPTIALNGNGAAGVKAAGGSTINLDDKVVTQFSTTATDQTAFWVSGKANDGTSSKINVAATTNPYGASGERSTLFYVDNGANLSGALKINVSGKQASGIKVSDVGTKAVVDAGSQITVNGENATGIRATHGGEAEIKSGAAFIVSGTGATIGLAEDLGSKITNAAAVMSATGSSGSTAFIARDSGELNNTGNIDLSQGSDHVAISVKNGIVTNSGDIKASGTAIYIEGENSVINNSGTIAATNGKAAIELGLDASLNLAALSGNGTITTKGTADGILLSQGAKGLNVSNTIIDMSDASSTGVGIHNKAGISGIKLDNTTIKVNNGVGIYTGSTLDKVNSGLIEVAGGIGILYQNVDGSATNNDLDLSGSQGLSIDINAAGGRGIVANLTGSNKSVNTAINVNINDSAGGAALDIQGADTLIQNGNLISKSSDVIKAGTATSISNSGRIEAGDRSQNLIVMDAALNKQFTNTGSLVGQLNFDGGTNNVQLNDGSDIDGDIALGSGTSNQLSMSGTSNQLTGNVTATGRDTRISLAESATINGNVQLAAGQNQIDLQDNGQLYGNLNVGTGNNIITLTDNAKISGSITTGAGNNSLRLSGQSQIDNFTAADGGENHVTVKGQATFRQLNAGLGGANDSLTFDNVSYTLTNVQNIQHFDRINLTNGSAFTTAQQIQMGDGQDSSGYIEIDQHSSLTLNSTAAYMLNHGLSGNGLLNVTAASQFDFGANSGNQFTGTVAMNSANFALSGFNTSALTKAMLEVKQNNTTTVGNGIQTIGSLTLDGGTLDFGLYLPGTVTSGAFIDITGVLDVSKSGQIKVNKSVFENNSTPIVNQSLGLLDQQNETLLQLASAGSVLTGGALSLVDQNGNTVSSATQEMITQNGANAALATYDYRVVTDGENGGGLSVGYGLSELELLSSGTDQLLIDVANSSGRSLTAKVTGSGDLGIAAGDGSDSLTISHLNNDYTGNTDLKTGTLKLGSDNALGHSDKLKLANATTVDINGKQQTLGQLNGISGSTLNLNGGELTLTNGGTSAGNLTGAGQLKVDGGKLTVTKENTALNANTLVAEFAEVVLNNVQALGNGNLMVNGKATLDNADGNLANQLSGSGELNINNGSDVRLSGDNSGFSSVINIDTASTLTVGENKHIGGATLIDNGNRFIADNGAAMTLSSIVQGSGDLVKTNAGTLTLSGANAYSGKTLIQNGVVAISADANLGDGSSTNQTVLDGGDLQITSDLTSDRYVTLSQVANVVVDAGLIATMAGWDDQGNSNNAITKSGGGKLIWTGNKQRQYCGSNG
ncbi:autotransporter-associated beta strand repeat-containing protein [Budvicia aquatica]|uniref:Putative lipoprotein n=1 Tax=Budvicia aquatica TaxID=82979 RepID=A0A485A0G3_9GAMM|nr:autotransporter-associated beta strand repeat-containing protein [Budvicia aquatica]VFS50999.1 putative lipoprotein [Budvicia aquatica]